MSFEKEIAKIREDFSNEIREVKTTKEIENLRVKYLGKKGSVQGLMIHLKEVNPDDRPKFGKCINDIKNEITSHLENTLKRLAIEEQEKKFQQEYIDISLPGRKKNWGRFHPITLLANRMIDILAGMGFSVEDGPNLDSDYYNFEALNFSKDHPAREMQDTFYVTDDLLMRTHTSNVQVRAMEKFKPPLRIIAPGRCFRNETVSARSHVFFHQIELFYVDKNVSFADLFDTMNEFWSKLFEKDIKTRFRPSYFPFVEPGMEVDIECLVCSGKGCRICKDSGWLEVTGAGMIHPEVLKFGGIDPEKFTGYAAGLGVERLALLYYGIKDIRMFTENDMRFLHQFPA